MWFFYLKNMYVFYVFEYANNKFGKNFIEWITAIISGYENEIWVSEDRLSNLQHNFYIFCLFKRR